MRPELARQILRISFGTPEITVGAIVDTIRQVIRDPIKAEKMVGTILGKAFRMQEVAYDARGGRS